MIDEPSLLDLPIFRNTGPSPLVQRFDLASEDLPDWMTSPSAPTRKSAAAVPAGRTVPQPTPAGDVGELDWPLVNTFRRNASARLAAVAKGDNLTVAELQDAGRRIIDDLLEDDARQALATGRIPFTLAEQRRMAVAIFDALFRLGRLQPLVDRDDIENIEVFGFDNVFLEDTGGNVLVGPPIADSDEELIEFLTFIASRSAGSARAFSEASPRLHLVLDDGSRMAAMAWVTPRPAVVIRRHRLKEVSLADLAARGTLSPNLASFLDAAVKAQRSIVVAGAQGAGKTTLVRALCGAIPPWERIGTFETEYELHLDELPDKHHRVVPFEARPGAGEREPDGRMAGEITVSDLLFDSFRFNLSRQIVGEVRGPEVLAMIKAMQSGNGSISTTHARSARAAVGKLVTCAMEAGAHITEAYATRAIAESIDLVVYINLDADSHAPGRRSQRSRYVTEVVAVEMGGDGVSMTDVYLPGADGRAVPHVLPDSYRDLVRFGFDMASFTREASR